MKANSDETFLQFCDRLRRVFVMWMESSEVDMNSPEDILSFVLRDQFIASLPGDLRIFLKERKFADLNELVEAADLWMSASGCNFDQVQMASISYEQRTSLRS